MSVKIPTVKLNSGLSIPVFGMGVWKCVSGKDEEIKQTVKDAIDLGYRLFNCAHLYGNERAFGDAFKEKNEEGVVNREDLFIVGQLRCNCQKPDSVEPELLNLLRDLQTSYLDLFLVDCPDFSKSEKECLISEADFIKVWRSMEDVYGKKLARGIGLSNFTSTQIDEVLNVATVFPQVNQIDCHPLRNQKDLREYCRRSWIAVVNCSLLDGSKSDATTEHADVITDSIIKEIAHRYGRSTSQILLKYSLQSGDIVTPNFCNKNALTENMRLFDFYLAPEDMNYIDSMKQIRD